MKTPAIKQLEQALKQDELFEYITGQNGYEYVCPYADIPTYDEVVFGSFIGYYDMYKDKSIWDKFEAGWIAISLSPDYSWFSLYYLFLYLRKFNDLNNTLIAIRELLPNLTKNIQGNKKFLRKDQRWMGRGFPNGLWDNATKMAAVINREFQLNILLN